MARGDGSTGNMGNALDSQLGGGLDWIAAADGVVFPLVHADQYSGQRSGNPTARTDHGTGHGSHGYSRNVVVADIDIEQREFLSSQVDDRRRGMAGKRVARLPVRTSSGSLVHRGLL